MLNKSIFEPLFGKPADRNPKPTASLPPPSTQQVSLPKVQPTISTQLKSTQPTTLAGFLDDPNKKLLLILLAILIILIAYLVYKKTTKKKKKKSTYTEEQLQEDYNNYKRLK